MSNKIYALVALPVNLMKLPVIEKVFLTKAEAHRFYLEECSDYFQTVSVIREITTPFEFATTQATSIYPNGVPANYLGADSLRAEVYNLLAQE